MSGIINAEAIDIPLLAYSIQMPCGAGQPANVRNRFKSTAISRGAIGLRDPARAVIFMESVPTHPFSFILVDAASGLAETSSF
jgi:hypothetical protein